MPKHVSKVMYNHPSSSPTFWFHVWRILSKDHTGILNTLFLRFNKKVFEHMCIWTRSMA